MLLTGTVSSKAPCRSMDSSAGRRHAGLKSPGRDDTERDESCQHEQLGDGKRRFWTRRRELLEKWQLLESLHARHKCIKLKSPQLTGHGHPISCPSPPR